MDSSEENLAHELMKLEMKNEETEIIKEGYDILNDSILLGEIGKEESKIKTQDKRANENKLDIRDLFPYFDLQNNLDEEILLESFICPPDNKLSGKQSKKIIENNENIYISKKTTRSNTKQNNFNIDKQNIKIRKHGILSEIKSIFSRKRKIHDNKTFDNKLTKIKSFIFKILILFLNQFSEKLFIGKKYCLHQICCKQAINGNVDFNKELMKKKLRIILSDTGDDYNEKLLNLLAKCPIINLILELKLEDIFNYLRNQIKDEITEKNKIFKIEKIHDKNNFYQNELDKKDKDDKKIIENSFKELNLYYFYKSELNKRNDDDKNIIEDSIKEDFVKIINGRNKKNKKK
jgi:hypothetical protein